MNRQLTEIPLAFVAYTATGKVVFQRYRAPSAFAGLQGDVVMDPDVADELAEQLKQHAAKARQMTEQKL